MRLKAVSGIILSLLLVGMLPLAFNVQPVVAGAAVDWWPMRGHDPNHTGYSTSTAPNTNHTIWTYTTGYWVESSPAVADGKVYVGSYDNKVYCLDASTGALIWNYTTGNIVYSSPAVADGKVYVGSSDNKVYCLNASTGAYIWSYTTGYFVYSSPAVADGKVYVGSNDNKVYCLDASTGALIWNYTTGYVVESSPAVADGKVYVGSNDCNVYCLNASTGAYIWSYTTVFHIVYSSPAVADGKVYVGSGDRNVYCLNASAASMTPDERKIWNYTTGGYVGSSPAVADGKVYVGSIGDNKVHCLDASTGALIWNYTTGGYVGSSPAVADGKVYVGSYDMKVYCLNASTGEHIWNYTTGNPVESSPAVADGKVYVGSWDGKLYAFGVTRDVAVTNVTSSKNVVGQGYSMYINVTVENQGELTETFGVVTPYFEGTVISTSIQWETFWSMGDVNRDGYIDNTDGNLIEAALMSQPGDLNWNPDADLNEDLIVNFSDLGVWAPNWGLNIWTHFGLPIPPKGTQRGVKLDPGNQTTLTFTWNTTGFAKGNYVISANATTVPGETDTADNTLTDGLVTVACPGDLTGSYEVPDGIVNMRDISLVAKGFGANLVTDPEDPRYGQYWHPTPCNMCPHSPNCDLTGPTPGLPDGTINMRDVSLVASLFGTGGC